MRWWDKDGAWRAVEAGLDRELSARHLLQRSHGFVPGLESQRCGWIAQMAAFGSHLGSSAFDSPDCRQRLSRSPSEQEI